MPVVTYTCEFADCDWEAKTETVKDYVALYQIHVQARHPNTGAAATSKAEKAKRPELSSDVSEEDWSYFTTRWEQYKKATGLKGDDIITQLLVWFGEPGGSILRQQESHGAIQRATEAAGSRQEGVLG